jgi:hypothetical protein
MTYNHYQSKLYAGRPIAKILTEMFVTCPDELNLTIPVTVEVVTELIITKTSLPIVPPALIGVAVTIGGYLNSDAKFTVNDLVVFAETGSSEIMSTNVA